MKNQNIPKIIIVNENDEIIGYKIRNEMEKQEIYRVSALWVTNSQGEILLAKRSHTKKQNPGKWGPAVAGTIEENESYDSNIIKEAEEEIGLKNIIPKLGPKIKSDHDYHHFTQWYTMIIDKNINEFKLQEDEVEEIKWIKPEELKKQLENNPNVFLSSIEICLKMFKNT